MSLLQQLSADLADLVARTAPAVVGIRHRRGQGSGLAISPDGYVLTNSHVAMAEGPLRVCLAGGEEEDAERVGEDTHTDLAVVRTARRALPSLALDEERRVRVGELVVAIGNPFGFERSVSLGVVSALHRDLPTGLGVLEALVQTDASVNPGNSGGPLLDAEGRVVGITTAMIPWARGLGFAVPAPTASWVAAVLIQQGHVRRPWLGVVARAEQVGDRRAVRVLRVEQGAPAAQAGLRQGDLMLAAAGRPVASIDDVQRAMVLGAGAEMELEVMRDGAIARLRARPRPARAA